MYMGILLLLELVGKKCCWKGQPKPVVGVEPTNVPEDTCTLTPPIGPLFFIHTQILHMVNWCLMYKGYSSTHFYGYSISVLVTGKIGGTFLDPRLFVHSLFFLFIILRAGTLEGVLTGKLALLGQANRQSLLLATYCLVQAGTSVADLDLSWHVITGPAPHAKSASRID